jgi:putative transposase
MKRFKSALQAQRFLSAHDQIANLFHHRRDHISASEYRAAKARAFKVWWTPLLFPLVAHNSTAREKGR